LLEHIFKILAMKKFIQLFFILFLSYGFSQNNLLQSGPMVGYCEMKEAVIWLQTKENASVKIEYFAIDNPVNVFVSENYSSSKEVGFTYHIVLDKLQPGKKYKYNVFINNKMVVLPYETSFSSKKLWQWREDAPDFTVALGSCTYINEPEVDRPGKGYGSGYSIFESINSKNPDIMIWGGDNLYLREVDWDSKTGILHRYTHSRSIKEIQPLLAKTQNFAIWDDHDFGPNDSDRSFYNKNLTLEAFKYFWANKSYGMNPEQNEGNYSTFNWGDVQFFLLDNRFFKSPNDRETGTKTLLGDKQFEWLIDALSYSKATFKIIYIGGQVITTAARFENYATYPEEKEKLLKEIETNKIKGVLFLSGDRHFTELSKLDRKGTYPLYDWTVSPLTSGIATSYKEDKNTNQVAGSLFAENNFGIISFSGDKDNRQMKLTLYNKEGKELWNKIISKKELE
jgi:alkaline phosphatase D